MKKFLENPTEVLSFCNVDINDIVESSLIDTAFRLRYVLEAYDHLARAMGEPKMIQARLVMELYKRIACLYSSLKIVSENNDFVTLIFLEMDFIEESVSLGIMESRNMYNRCGSYKNVQEYCERRTLK